MAAVPVSRYVRSSFPSRREYSSLAVARLNVTFLDVCAFSRGCDKKAFSVDDSSENELRTVGTETVYYSNVNGTWRLEYF